MHAALGQALLLDAVQPFSVDLRISFSWQAGELCELG